MASDLSQIVQDELANTLEQLLSKKTEIKAAELFDGEGCSSEQCIAVETKYEFSNLTTTWKFFIPTLAATKFEYFMLGGMGDLKEHIDDEIADAVNEIVSNISGSICTSVNAQGFEDLGNVKFEVLGYEIVETAVLKATSDLYKFELDMEGESLLVFISFEESFLPYISTITGIEAEESADTAVPKAASPVASQSNAPAQVMHPMIDEDA